MNAIRSIRTGWMCLLASLALLGAGSAFAANETTIDADSQAALTALYQESPTAKSLGQKAKGVLVFQNIVKAGFVVGGQSGDGVLLKQGKRAGYYHSAAVTVGMQAGAQSFAFAIFFMSDKAMNDFEKSKGWEIGVGPNIVIVDSGAAKDISTLTAKADVYGFVFGQKGLMGGVGLQGTKISKLKS